MMKQYTCHQCHRHNLITSPPYYKHVILKSLHLACPPSSSHCSIMISHCHLGWRRCRLKNQSYISDWLELQLKWAILIGWTSSLCCLSVRSYVCCKLFKFSFSSQEPLGQFRSNLAQSIFKWREFKFFRMKGYALYQGVIITK